MPTSSDWFIAARVRRLVPVLASVTTASPGCTIERYIEGLTSTISGPRDELRAHVTVLSELGLLRVDRGRVFLTAEGTRTASMRDDRAQLHIAGKVLRSGLMHDQIRLLIEASTTRADGSAFIRSGALRRLAPQLSGILQLWPNVVGRDIVDVPAVLFADLDTPWSLIPLPRLDDGRKKAVGSRAEAYSFHYLRQLGSRPPHLTWVALDDESLGYDIEDRSLGAHHRIEVKASEQRHVRFFLSDNEHRVAHVDPGTYAVHFWGEINLNRDPNTEYAILTSRGFPIVFDDLVDHLHDGRLEATPVKYRVLPGTPAPTAAAGS